MLKRIIKIFGEEIVKGSFILFIMMNIFNFLNYVFHFSMARLLGPTDYSVLAVLMSIVYIFSVPAEGIQTVVSRYTVRFNIKKEHGKIKYLLIMAIKKLAYSSIILFLIYIPVAFFLGYFTKISAGLFIFTGTLIFGILLVPVFRGIIQGEKKFKSLGYNMIIESILKVILSTIFVVVGFNVYGAVGGVISAVLITLLISFIFIKKIFKSKIEKTKIEGILSYSFPVLIVIFTIMVMASLDIIFVKSVFSSETAGKYAVVSMLGKMIFFGTFSISKAMFPLTSENYDKGDKTKNIFKRAFFLVLGVCIVAVLGFWIFPKLIIGILFGSQYLDVSEILVFAGLSFSFLSLSNLSLIYLLSVRKKKLTWFVLFILLETVAFIFFHGSLKEFSIAFMIINLIMFIVSLIFIRG